MERERFEKLVGDALDQIPDQLASRLDNVDVVVGDWPTKEQLIGSGIDEGEFLLGLYEGLPLTERYDYNMVLPDKITLFQGAIEAICSTDEEIVLEVRDTVVHEVAHHFGIDDDVLHEMGR
jgi:predicted Zn-dependent protease with MMP-like domain